jgi:hypothetical protein
MDSFEQPARKLLCNVVEQSPKSISELSNMLDEKESKLQNYFDLHERQEGQR